MEAFLPSLTAGWQAGGLIIILLAAGRLLSRTPRAGGAAQGDARRALAWALVLGGALAAHGISLDEPPGFRMVAIVTALLIGMKAVVAVEAALRGTALSLPRWLGFAALWFGMDPGPFALPSNGPAAGARRLVIAGICGLILGLSGIWWAREWQAAGGPRLAIVLLLLVSASAVLHFGILRLSSGLWRLLGVPARDLFRAPILAESLRDFWGRRWNMGFHEMTRTAVYRPLAPSLGQGGAIMASFLFSGVLHEAAISWPVRAGYGGPLAYFALQGALLLLESALAARGRTPRGAAGRLWTVASLVAPLPLLFHAPFLEGVLLPLLLRS